MQTRRPMHERTAGCAIVAAELALTASEKATTMTRDEPAAIVDEAIWEMLDEIETGGVLRRSA